MMTFEYSVKQSNYVDYLTRRNNFISTQSEDLKNGKSIYYLIFKGTESVAIPYLLIDFLMKNFSTTNEQIQAEDNDDIENVFNKLTIRLK